MGTLCDLASVTHFRAFSNKSLETLLGSDAIEAFQPFTSNIVTRLKARRAKGSKCTEDEMLADAERHPWEFDESSSNESSHSDDEDEDKPAAKKKRTDSP